MVLISCILKIMIDFIIKQGLEVVAPERFLLLSVIEDSELLTFIESQVDPRQPNKNLVFHRGNAFYEFSHESEDVTGKKEVVLMDVVRSYTSTLWLLILPLDYLYVGNKGPIYRRESKNNAGCTWNKNQKSICR